MNRSTEPNVADIHAAYALGGDDVAHAYRLHHRAQMRRWPTLLAGLVALAILVDAASILMAGDARGFAVVVACGVFGGVAVPAAMLRFVVPLRARRLHAGSRLLREAVVLSANAAGVRVTAPDAVTHRPWSGITGWRENQHVILLYHGDGQFLIVPQHAIPSDARDSLRCWYDSARRRGASPAPVQAGDTRVGPQAEGDLPVLAASDTWVVERADLAAAQRLFLRWHWLRPRAHTVPVVLAACAGVLAASSSPVTWTAVAAPVLVVLAGFVGLYASLYALLPILAGRFRRRQPDLGLPWRVELDARGLRAITPEQDVRTPWDAYVAWAADHRVLLVYRSDGVFQFLPVRALDAAFQAAFWRCVTGLPRR